MVSSMATGALGLVYWMIAERMLPTSEVGRASAMISTATAMSSLACLSLAGAYERFLPVAGHRTTRLILGGYALIGATSAILGTGFVLLGFGSKLFHSTTDKVMFPLLVLVLAYYAITDPILIGLRRSPAVAAKNVFLSVTKIIPLFFLTGTATAMAVAGSWLLLAALTTAVFIVHVVRIAIGRRTESSEELPAGRELMAFQGVFFTMMLVSSVVPFALPLIVVGTVGTTQNAYFNLAWTMNAAAGMLRSSFGAAFVVEAVQPGADGQSLVRQLKRMLIPLTLVVAAGLAVGGPVLLWVVGAEYAREAGPLMVILAAQSIIDTVVIVYFMVAQIQRKLRLMLIVQIMIVTVTVAGSVLLLPHIGLIGVGCASIAAPAIAFAVVIGPLITGIREMQHAEHPTHQPEPLTQQ